MKQTQDRQYMWHVAGTGAKNKTEHPCMFAIGMESVGSSWGSGFRRLVGCLRGKDVKCSSSARTSALLVECLSSVSFSQLGVSTRVC